MIIWGSRARVHRIGAGVFFCPRCMNETPYAHLRVSRYFTLYFVPLFPTSTLGQFVRCQACHGEYKETALAITREDVLSAMAPWTCGHCHNRNPSTEARCVACGGSRADAIAALPPAAAPALPGPAPALPTPQTQPPLNSPT